MTETGPLHKPLGLLAELTHRCPLGCPYCSNPLALEPRTDELDAATWARVFTEAAALGVLHVHLSGGEPGARRDLVDIAAHAREAGPLHQPDHLGRRHHQPHHARPVGGRPRSRPGLDPGRRRGVGRPHRRLSRRVPAQARAGRGGGAARPAADRQSRGASRQHRAHFRDGRSGAGAEGRPDRDRPCAVLRLGAAEPRGADADRRAGQARRGRGRGASAQAPRPDRDRRGGAGLSRPLAEALRRRLGPPLAQCHAIGPRAAMPRRGIDPGAGVLERPRAFAGRHLGPFAGLQCLPRHRFPARALRKLRAARDRFRRLPLPGLSADRRRPRHRPGVPSVAAPWPGRPGLPRCRTTRPTPTGISRIFFSSAGCPNPDCARGAICPTLPAGKPSRAAGLSGETNPAASASGEECMSISSITSVDCWLPQASRF